MSIRRSAFLATLVATLALAAPASAQQFGITQFSVTPANPQAGAHSDVSIVTGFPAGPGQPHAKNLTIHLPPGLVGNPEVVPKCTQAQFDGVACPGPTQVGTTLVDATVDPLGLPLPIQIPNIAGEVYNLEPAGGAPARLGIVVRPPLQPPITIPVAITVRPGDAGLDSAVVDLPTSVPLGEAWISKMTLTLEGDSPQFMTNPTSCIPATASVEATSYDGQSRQANAAPFTPTNCGAVPFDPTVGATVETARRSAPSGYTVTLGLPVGHSNVKRAEVVLPEGTAISSPVAHGLEACTPEQFATAAGCPAAALIGSVSFVTPLLGQLGGEVFFGQPRPDGAMPLFVSVNQSGVSLKLTGVVTLDRGTGRITTVFDDLPQTPFTSFALSFKGGSRAVLSNPNACGTYTVSARLTPWAAAPGFPADRDRTPTGTFAIDAGCDQPFRPSMAIASTSTQAAGPAGAVALTVARPDGDQRIDRMTIDMPPGLVGKVTAAELCPEARAASGACQPGSRVGSAAVRVGSGPEPVTLGGTVFLTGPTGTAPLGLAIALSAKVGPLDLGTVVTRAGIVLRPTDGGLTVTTTSLPRILQGIPVDIRELTLTLDRPGFMLNPSGCDLRRVRGHFAAVGGGEAAAETRYQATGCDRVPYRPTISGTIGAKGLTANGKKPPLSTSVKNPPGHAANRTVAVTLPREVGIDLKRVNQLTCRTPQLQAGTCPPLTKVGTVRAQTSLLPFPLTGPVILSERGPGKLPGLTVQLEGPVSLRLDGSAELTKQGIRTTFNNVPDVPLDRLELSLKGGRDGALVLGRDLCSIRPLIAGEFQGHNGKKVTHRERMTVEGCNPPRVRIKLRRLRSSTPVLHLAVRRRSSKAPKIRRVSVRLPQSLRAHPRARAGVVGRRDKRRLTRKRVRLNRSGTLTVRLPRKGSSVVRVTLRKGAFTTTRSLKRKLRTGRRRPRLSFRVDVTNRDRTRNRITKRVRAPRR